MVIQHTYISKKQIKGWVFGKMMKKHHHLLNIIVKFFNNQENSKYSGGSEFKSTFTPIDSLSLNDTVNHQNISHFTLKDFPTSSVSNTLKEIYIQKEKGYFNIAR